VTARHAEYDDIAAEYAASKQLPFRIVVEAPTLFRLAGDVAGLDILDLACGEGTYSRAFARRGAKSVMGIDLSDAMVERARGIERDAPLGTSYRQGDAASLGKVGAFDLVLTSYLFNYAQTPEQLAAFARTVQANLKPGGRLIGINDNPLTPEDRYVSLEAFGFTRTVERPRRPGSRVRYQFGNWGFDNFWLAPATYRQVFAETGLVDFRFVPPSADIKGGEEPALWQRFLEDCPIVGLEARHP
jgi:SAM-dependent methyltransferase